MHTLLAVVALASFADACSRRSPPPPPPPPTAPPPPNPPPPIVKVVRTAEQNVGFNKCFRVCSGRNTQIDQQSGAPVGESNSAFGVDCRASTTLQSTYGGGPVTEDNNGQMVTYTTPDGKPCAMQTNCVYKCTFDVFTEVALRTITKPTNCGCAFHINIVKPRPARVIGAKYATVAQSIEVSDFTLVVWDFKANRVVEKVPAFTLPRSETTKQAIAEQVKSGTTDDYTSLTAGFAGEVTRFENLPASLNLNLPENENNVPALKFTVTQTYTDTKSWEPPAKPDLEKMPNAWQSQCVPYWPERPFCYNDKKRQANAACGSARPQLWMKRFFLFPKESQLRQETGKTYAARMITSFYSADTCRVKDGVFSVDSEFTQSLEQTDGGIQLAIGTWGWKRVFVDDQGGKKFGTRYIHAVPGKFSAIQEVWDKGYSTISWFAPNGWTTPHPLHKTICQQWNPAAGPQEETKYGEFVTSNGARENIRNYPAQAGIRCAPFDDVVNSGAQCGTSNAPDRSLMAFINEGQILNFNKNEDSILAIGKTSVGCRPSPYAETLFDVLQFHGVIAGQEPITRAEKRELHDDRHELGLVYDEEEGAFRHWLHPGAHEMLQNQRRKRAADVLDKLDSQVATPPNENDFDMRMATGSVDKNGGVSADANDHPIELFPETFSAPVNIDPKANSPVVVDGAATTGSRPPACNKGSIGCSCRVTGAEPCDLGLTCASNGKCLTKDCKPGEAGCSCANNACSDSSTECKAGVCAVKLSCKAGTAGCECDQSTCSEGKCRDGICLLDAGCASGAGGCVCSESPIDFSAQQAVEGKLYCNKGFECDTIMGACLVPRCKSGEPGCRCRGDKSCAPGFECDLAKNVCSVIACPAGDPGCQCKTGNQCNKVGFRCEAFSTTGDRRCVADGDTCSPDGLTSTQRCVKFCGAGNVLRCPPCANGRPFCKSVGIAEFNEQCKLPENAQRPLCTLCKRDPFNPQCPGASLAVNPSSAAHSLLALAAAVVAIVAALF